MKHAAEAVDAEIARWQAEFLRGVQSPHGTEHELAGTGLWSDLEAATRHRLEVYRTGHYARVSYTLADTLFERASALLSREVMAGILGRFFEAHPASAPNLVAASEGVAKFAKMLDDVSEHPWIPDFLTLCERRWAVLTGPDPSPATLHTAASTESSTEAGAESVPHPACSKLQANHFFLASEFAVFSLWNAADDEIADIPSGSLDACVPQAMLLFKSSALTLENVLVPQDFFPFVQALSNGSTLLDAIDALDSQAVDPEALDAAAFGAFVTSLAARGAFATHTIR